MSNRFMDLLRPHLQRLQSGNAIEDEPTIPDQQSSYADALEAEGRERLDPDLRFEWQEVPADAWLSPGETPEVEIEHFDEAPHLGED